MGHAVITCEISLCECLVGGGHPIADLEALYIEFLSSPWINLLPVTMDIILTASRHANRTSSKLMDSIHVAAAEAGGCLLFLTNDTRLKVPASLRKVMLSDIAKSLSQPSSLVVAFASA